VFFFGPLIIFLALPSYKVFDDVIAGSVKICYDRNVIQINSNLKYKETMKKLDERKKGFEGKFARDQELEFKILARRNKYLGVWAAEKLRLSGPAVEEYFAEVIKSDLEEDGDMDVFRKVRKDFDEKGISITDDELRQSMDQFLLQAKEEIIGKDNI